MESDKVKVLCVDDEPAVLEGLLLHLRRRYQTFTCESGPEALEVLGREKGVAVIVSDMRMPGMNGAEFLAKACAVAPDASRILLTGQTDLDSAILAINEGKIFRFLTKPCQPPTLLSAFEAGVELHRLRLAEKVLLEQTLRGAIQVLVEVLGLASPEAFGRALRIKNLACMIADEVGAGDRWQLEVAAMLSHVGFVGLPLDTLEKVLAGDPLDDEEQAAADKVPQLLERLLAPIPRLEVIREILARVHWPAKKLATDKLNPSTRRNSQILKAAMELSRFEVQTSSGATHFEALRGRLVDYPDDIVAAIAKIAAAAGSRLSEVKDVRFNALKVGMVLVQDLKTSTGVLVVPKGFEITESFLARMANFRSGALPGTIKVLIRAAWAE